MEEFQRNGMSLPNLLSLWQTMDLGDTTSIQELQFLFPIPPEFSTAMYVVARGQRFATIAMGQESRDATNVLELGEQKSFGPKSWKIVLLVLQLGILAAEIAVPVAH